MRGLKFRAWYNDHMIEDSSFYIREDGVVFNDKMDEREYVLMQWTGLLDKNGKEIWEGDVIAMKYKGGGIFRQGEVKWGVYNIGANGYEYDFNIVGPYVEDESMYDSMIDGSVEIIGNIYETPSLITP